MPPTTPARPARPAPIAKVMANTICTLTPEADSMPRSSTPARIIMPTRVLGEERPQAYADDDGRGQQDQPIGRELADERQGRRAGDPARRIELVDLAAPDPERDIGRDDREADRRHGLAQIVALHEAEHADLQGEPHQSREQEACCHGHEPGAGELAHHPADIGTEQVERAVG